MSRAANKMIEHFYRLKNVAQVRQNIPITAQNQKWLQRKD